MVMQLGSVVPFGRSLDEYQCMFELSATDLDKSIVSLADGPASFNAEMFALGRRVVSVDPLYSFDRADIERQFYCVVDDIILQIKRTLADWVWTYHASPDHLRESRIQTLGRFLDDFDLGRSQGRYVVGQLPNTQLPDNSFQLALCSHFLFLYADHFPYEFHRAAVLEMLRLAPEVRIFPLLTLMLEPSSYVPRLIDEMQASGYECCVRTVTYQLQRGGNQMLCVKKR
ncbi:MAG: hypothetical protein KF752_10800 [Pirellulaceae bacterium]|nr:hypothetical protein [Pirellulaceae bacterium]